MTSLIMTPEQMARLVAGDFDCHDYVEINIGGTNPNEADFETLDSPHRVIRELATEVTTLQQEKAALQQERDEALRQRQERSHDAIAATLCAEQAEATTRRLRAALEQARTALHQLRVAVDAHTALCGSAPDWLLRDHAAQAAAVYDYTNAALTETEGPS